MKNFAIIFGKNWLYYSSDDYNKVCQKADELNKIFSKPSDINKRRPFWAGRKISENRLEITNEYYNNGIKAIADNRVYIEPYVGANITALSVMPKEAIVNLTICNRKKPHIIVNTFLSIKKEEAIERIRADRTTSRNNSYKFKVIDFED